MSHVEPINEWWGLRILSTKKTCEIVVSSIQYKPNDIVAWSWKSDRFVYTKITNVTIVNNLDSAIASIRDLSRLLPETSDFTMDDADCKSLVEYANYMYQEEIVVESDGEMIMVLDFSIMSVPQNIDLLQNQISLAIHEYKSEQATYVRVMAQMRGDNRNSDSRINYASDGFEVCLRRKHEKLNVWKSALTKMSHKKIK